MATDELGPLLATALEAGEAPPALIARLKEADGDGEVAAAGQELFILAAAFEDGATAVAAVVFSLLQELPPEQGRVLRRVLLTAANQAFEAAVGGGRERHAICTLLCELFLVDAIPETVLHAALEALLWDIRDPLPADVDCACSMLQAVGRLLDSSDLEASELLMDDLFQCLTQLAALDALPHEQQQAVRSLLRLRAAGWEEAQAAAAPHLEMLPTTGKGQAAAEDWRSVLDRKQASASANGSVQGGSAEALTPAAPEPAAPEAAAPAQQRASPVQLRQEAVAAVVAAIPTAADAAWDVPALVAAVRGQAGLDLSAEADAEQLAVTLADRATSAAAAEAAPGPDGEPLQLLPGITGCAELLAELAGGQAAVGTAASTHLSSAFKRRSEARSREARRLLAQQMLLAGSLAQHGALPEQQLHSMLEQLARQVMKPSAWDVVCLSALLRGAGPASEARKGQWWKAAQQLSTSANVAPEQQRELAFVLALREHRWDPAAAAAAAAELDARKAADAAADALEAATLQRQAQEDAAARAAAEAAKAEEQVKAAAARLAELERQQASAVAAAAAARRTQAEAEAAAEAAAKRRTDSDRAAAAAKKQAADAQAEAMRAQQAGAAPAAGGAAEQGRHWYCAAASTGEGFAGPFTAAELVAWLYQDPLLEGEMQVIKAGESQWGRMGDRVAEVLAGVPPRPSLGSSQPPAPAQAGGRGGRGGLMGGRFPVPGRGGRGGRGPPPTGFPPEHSPASEATAAGRGGRGRGGREAGRAGRGRGRGESSFYPQQQQQQAAAQQVPQQRAASPPRYGLEDMLPHIYGLGLDNALPPRSPAAPAAAAAQPPSYGGGGYNPLGQQRPAPAATPPRSSGNTGVCPTCSTRESAHIWLQCGHLGHCNECMPDFLSNEEKLANCPVCLVCGQPADSYLRIYK